MYDNCEPVASTVRYYYDLQIIVDQCNENVSKRKKRQPKKSGWANGSSKNQTVVRWPNAPWKYVMALMGPNGVKNETN